MTVCRALQGHEHPIRCVSFGATGFYMLSTSDDGKVKIWSPSLTLLHSLPVRALLMRAAHSPAFERAAMPPPDIAQVSTCVTYARVTLQHYNCNIIIVTI